MNMSCECLQFYSFCSRFCKFENRLNIFLPVLSDFSNIFIFYIIDAISFTYLFSLFLQILTLYSHLPIMSHSSASVVSYATATQYLYIYSKIFCQMKMDLWCCPTLTEKILASDQSVIWCHVCECWHSSPRSLWKMATVCQG